MPAIADPYLSRSNVSAVTDERARWLRARVRAALHRDDLTRALAAGVDPTSSDELSLRAAQLTNTRSRRSLARGLRRTIDEAHKPPMARPGTVIIRRGAVLEAEDAIRTMIARLGSSQPLRAEGMAIAERILTNAERSPLYNRAEPGALRREISVATAAMSPPDHSESHSFAVGA